MNPYESPQSDPLAEASGEIDPRLFAAVERVNKSTSGITKGLLVSIFIPIGMLVVIGFAIAALVRATKLYKSAPALLSLKTYCVGTSKAETKAMIKANPVLKVLSEFAQARIALWIIIFFPFVYIGSIFLLVKLVD